MTNSLKIFFTAAGAPQAATLIRHLKNNGERDLHLVGLDMNTEVIGRYMADNFYQIPEAGTAGYNERILDLIATEKPDAILNCSEADVPHISALTEEIEKLGTKVIASPPEALEIANNKYRLYQTVAEKSPDIVPQFCSPKSLAEFIEKAKEMGYPDRDLCFKPHVSKGSRGFRVLSERFDRRDLLLNHKPTSRYMSLKEFEEIFSSSEDFPDLLLMECLVGDELDAMTIAHDGEALLTTVKTRESHRWGVIDKGEHVDRPDIIRSVQEIVSVVPVAYNISLQFMGGKLIEINPRTSTFIFQDNLNEPWLAIKLGLGLISPEELRAYQDNVQFGKRLLRYMDQIMI